MTISSRMLLMLMLWLSVGRGVCVEHCGRLRCSGDGEVRMLGVNLTLMLLILLWMWDMLWHGRLGIIGVCDCVSFVSSI